MYLYEHSRFDNRVIIRPLPSESDKKNINLNYDNFFYVDDSGELVEQIQKPSIGIVISSSVAILMAYYGLKIIKLNLSCFKRDDTGYEEYDYVKVAYSIDELKMLINMIAVDECLSFVDRDLFVDQYVCCSGNDFVNNVMR